MPPKWKLPIRFKMIPEDMCQDIKFRHNYAVGENKGYENFSRILIELANEKVYDKRAAKCRGENDSDTDLVDSETRQFREAPNDEHPDHTEQEWIDLEAELQEELNWLSARKGKGKGKGAREKGKGRGKTGKGSGACFCCGEFSHVKADCKKFAA